jgi:hypothetical protein
VPHPTAFMTAPGRSVNIPVQPGLQENNE